MCMYVHVCECACVFCVSAYAFMHTLYVWIHMYKLACVCGMKWNENTKFCFAMQWHFACVCDSCAVIPFQINIFNLDKADSVKDIDRAILYALLKGESFCQWHFFPYLFQFVFWWNHYFGGVLSWLCHLHRHHHDGLCHPIDCWLCGYVIMTIAMSSVWSCHHDCVTCIDTSLWWTVSPSWLSAVSSWVWLCHLSGHVIMTVSPA